MKMFQLQQHGQMMISLIFADQNAVNIKNKNDTHDKKFLRFLNGNKYIRNVS